MQHEIFSFFFLWFFSRGCSIRESFFEWPYTPFITTRHSIFLPFHEKNIITRHSSLATCHSPLVTRHSSLATRHSQLVTRNSSLATRHSQLATHFLAVPWKKIITRHLPLATRHSSNITTTEMSLMKMPPSKWSRRLLLVVNSRQFLPQLKKRHFRWRHFGLDVLRAWQIFRDTFVERQNLQVQEKRYIFVANHIHLLKCCFIFIF